MKYKEGDKVLAKWPGSKLYFKGQVTKTDGEKYNVLFEEGTSYLLKESEIKPEGSFQASSKSPKKSPRSRSRASPSRRSPARSSRSPARNKSPARPKSPSRRSPARKSAEKPVARRSPARKSPRKSPSRESRVEQILEEIKSRRSATPANKYLSEKEEIVRRTPLRETPVRSTPPPSSTPLRTRQSSELSSSSITIRRSTRISNSKESPFSSKVEEEEEFFENSVIKELDEDVENIFKKIRETTPLSLDNTLEFGGRLGIAVLMILQPIVMLSAYIYLSLENKSIAWKDLFNWRTYFNASMAGIYMGFMLSQFILSVLPIGKVVNGLPNKFGKLHYRCNGFLSLLVSLTAVGALNYYKFPITIILDKLLQILVPAMIFALCISFLLYIRGGRVSVAALNVHGSTGKKLYDFWMGREINPRIGPLDLKLTLYKSAVIGNALLNMIILSKGFGSEKGLSNTLLTACVLQILYSADCLLYESKLLTSFGIMYEGLGHMLAFGYCIYPFLSTITSVHLLQHRVDLPWYCLAALGVIWFAGYTIYRASNNQKSEFRVNPLNAKVSNLEAIHTSRGKKLLVSGWWGWIRHPNYIGDIVMHWATAATCGTSHWLPYLVPLFVTLFLLYRSERDNQRCQQRYNSSWEQYCSLVKYRVIPKVF